MISSRRIAWLALTCCFCSLGPVPARAEDNGLAKVSPKAWNGWNRFGCNVSEELIKSIADAMAILKFGPSR